MQKITTTAELRTAIFQLELKQEIQQKQLKEKFYLTYESFKSINLIKKILVEMATSPGLMSGIIKAILEMTDHKNQKHTTQDASDSIFKSILRTMVKFGVTNLIIQHADTIRAFGQYIIRRIFHKTEKKTEESE